MDASKLKASNTIQHIRKGDQYRVLAVGMMETGEGTWEPSVTFRKVNTNDVFTRPVKRVEAKFKIVPLD